MPATPTVRKKLLGGELRHLRDVAGWSQEAAGKLIGKTQNGISKIEAGDGSISVGDLEKLLRTYDVIENSPEWRLCLEWRAGSRQPRNYWSGYRAVFAENFRTFVELEADCDLLQAAWNEMLPDWLQSEDYMRAVFGAVPSRKNTIESAVSARKERQAVFHHDGGPTLHIVMSESCLRREYGPPEMMYQAIRHVIQLSERPNFKIQLLPFEYRSGRNQAASYAQFTGFRVPSGGMAGPLQYTCTHIGQQYQYTDDPDTVAVHNDQFADLSAIALDYVASRDLMIKVLRGYGR